MLNVLLFMINYKVPILFLFFSQFSVVHDESNETLQDNTVLARNNELINKNNSDDDDDDESQSLYDSNFNMNDRQNRVVEWMVAREGQKPYGGIIGKFKFKILEHK